MQDDNCEGTFGSEIPVWKIDWSSCKGKCMLRFFWLGLQDQGERWQVYSKSLRNYVSLHRASRLFEMVLTCASPCLDRIPCNRELHPSQEQVR